MIFKIAGSLILLLSSAGVGFELMSVKKERLRQLDELIGLISHIKSNIDYFMTPVNDILSDYTSVSLEDCGFLEIMRKSDLKSAVLSGAARLCDSEIKLLSEFSDNLGVGYKEEEIRLCDYYIQKLTLASEKEKEKIEKNRNMYKYIPVLCAASIILAVI